MDEDDEDGEVEEEPMRGGSSLPDGIAKKGSPSHISLHQRHIYITFHLW